MGSLPTNELSQSTRHITILCWAAVPTNGQIPDVNATLFHHIDFDICKCQVMMAIAKQGEPKLMSLLDLTFVFSSRETLCAMSWKQVKLDLPLNHLLNMS